MKPSFTLHNDWRYVDGKYGDVNLLEFHFDWYSGASYYFTFRLLGFGFTLGAWDDTPANAALAELAKWETIPDDPEAHGIVHVGAQTATVTVEPLNPVSQTTGD